MIIESLNLISARQIRTLTHFFFFTIQVSALGFITTHKTHIERLIFVKIGKKNILFSSFWYLRMNRYVLPSTIRTSFEWNHPNFYNNFRVLMIILIQICDFFRWWCMPHYTILSTKWLFKWLLKNHLTHNEFVVRDCDHGHDYEHILLIMAQMSLEMKVYDFSPCHTIPGLFFFWGGGSACLHGIPLQKR